MEPTDSAELFLFAAKNKLRFESSRGALTAEQLFDLPLTSTYGFDLNSVAKSAAAQWRSMSEEDFVGGTSGSATLFAEKRLSLIKFVIAEKLEAVTKAKQAAARRLARNRILAALAEVESKELTSASKENLLKKLEALDEQG